MKTLPAAALLLALIVSSGAAEPLYYRSNGSAMALERIPSYRRDESDWILSVERTGRAEVRILYDKGSESRRWVRVTGASQVEERELAGGVLAARRVYDAAGSLLQEDLYAAGSLATKTTYAYAGGRLARTRTVDPSGSELFTDDYVYASNGSLRSVRRIAAGSTEQASVVSGTGGISEERSAAGDTLLVARYDAKGRATSREKRLNGVTVSREDFVFRTDKDALASSTEKIPALGTLIERLYDDEGRLSRETTTLGGGSVTVVTWTRDSAGRVVAKASRGARRAGDVDVHAAGGRLRGKGRIRAQGQPREGHDIRRRGEAHRGAVQGRGALSQGVLRRGQAAEGRGLVEREPRPRTRTYP